MHAWVATDQPPSPFPLVRERGVEGGVGAGVADDARCEFGVGDAARRYARDVDVAVDDLDVGRVGFEHLRRLVHHLLADLAGGVLERTAADRATAAAAGAEQAERGPAGVAEHQRHVVDRHAEFVGDDLAVGRLVALAVRHLRRVDDDRPVGLDGRLAPARRAAFRCRG